MSKDYSSLRNQLAGDFQAAATVAQGGSGRRIKVPSSDVPNLVPSGAQIEIETTTVTKLKMGDVVCVSIGRDVVIRRFIRLKMTKANTFIMVASKANREKEPLPHSALIGRVVSVTAGGITYDPLKKEGLLRSWWGQLTEYGTHKAFGFIG